MITRTKPHGPKDGGSYLARAQQRWSPVPDWVAVLARKLDATVAAGGSQGTVAKALDLKSASLISAVIGKTYQGRMDRIEAKVRGTYMSATVECPVLGVIGRDVCAHHQVQKFSASSPQSAQLHRACPVCPHNLDAKETP